MTGPRARLLGKTAVCWLRNSILSGRFPSRRAIAALAKLSGYRLERRWPILVRSGESGRNLGFTDLLHLQYTRSLEFRVLCVGAFDGETNDPVSGFLRAYPCQGLLLEPQVGAYARLRDRYSDLPHLQPLNLAVDEVSGERTLYYVPAGTSALPSWTEQLASFQLEHVLKHASDAPGLEAHICSEKVRTISFCDLLTTYRIEKLDLLHLDAEGMDAQLLLWFPFDRLKPRLLHYETAHASQEALSAVRLHLASLGYLVSEAESKSDDMAILP